MANTLYPKYKERTLKGEADFLGDDIKAYLAPSAYVYSAAHEFLSDLGTTIGTPQPLLNKVVPLGVFDADDVTFAALAPGSTVKAVVLVRDTGIPGTSNLVMYIDTVTGLPMSTNGADLTIKWSDGGYRIFAL